jgi:hypothetical protein
VVWTPQWSTGFPSVVLWPLESVLSATVAFIEKIVTLRISHLSGVIKLLGDSKYDKKCKIFLYREIDRAD